MFTPNLTRFFGATRNGEERVDAVANGDYDSGEENPVDRITREVEKRLFSDYVDDVMERSGEGQKRSEVEAQEMLHENEEEVDYEPGVEDTNFVTPQNDQSSNFFANAANRGARSICKSLGTSPRSGTEIPTATANLKNETRKLINQLVTETWLREQVLNKHAKKGGPKKHLLWDLAHSYLESIPGRQSPEDIPKSEKTAAFIFQQRDLFNEEYLPEGPHDVAGFVDWRNNFQKCFI